ncbi:MAG: protein kinase [Deltaproteobacteria bacterium]|nr:protein kinase [Deltaproteobacteria bacterium]
MSEGHDDTVAETPGAPAPRKDADKPETIGRYRVERVLGVGGMGTVYAAFDPDLERRVALKLLNSGSTGGELRARLLREARAMARLQHSNVVTVYEVGTEGGRDYVAMELVEGETLKAWLEVATREPDAIVAAFVAAGQGLAAAHAAGIVHRDFKPHNVLRRRDGRVMVTDFGLARGVEASAPVDAFDKTADAGSLSGLTRTGSVLGTPAYMAPEQWTGKLVGPRADQFSFCVALWEALTGERPFAAATFEELKALVQKGPPDPVKLPRALREPLVRGLQPDPEKRFVSMDALIAALTPRKRSALVVAGGAAAIALGAAITIAVRPAGEPPCPAPAIDPATIVYKDLDRVSVAAIAADLEHVAKLRKAACETAPDVRTPQLACLDGVLAHLALAADAAHDAKSIAQKDPTVHTDATSLLVDPDVCTHPKRPLLLQRETPLLREAAAAWLADTATPDNPDEPPTKALIAKTASEPCAAAFAHVLGAEATAGTERHQHVTDSESAAQLCADDWMSARLALSGVQQALRESLIGADSTAKLRRADALAQVSHDRGIDAMLALFQMQVALYAENLDQAAALAKQAEDLFAARGMRHQQYRAALGQIQIRRMRGKPEDLAAVPKLLADVRAAAAAQLGPDDPSVAMFDRERADWLFATGDVEHAHAEMDKLRVETAIKHPRHISGMVVDPSGAPVEGALVGAAERLRGDSVSAVMGMGAWTRTTHTDAEGRFELDASSEGAIVAEHAGMRSPSLAIADRVTLHLAPTSRIEGKVDLQGTAPERVTIIARDSAVSVADITYAVVAPVQKDGSYVVDGVQRGKVIVSTAIQGMTVKMNGVTVDVKDPVVRGVDLSLASSKRSIDILIRSTIGMPLPNAQIAVVPGVMPAQAKASAINVAAVSATLKTATHIEGGTVPERIKLASKPGDLFGTVSGIPDGPVSACAIAMPADLSDPTLTEKIISHMDQLEVRCAVVKDTNELIVLEVPPLPRLD